VIDVVAEINAVRRAVGSAELEEGEGRSITIARTYGTGLDDLWDCCTNPERIPRWFLPVSGELREGGRYQLEGNAGGTIRQCEPPRAFSATWEYGGDVSWIEVRLTPESEDSTRFELTHTARINDHWGEFGPGAVGVGWDLAILGLQTHLSTEIGMSQAEVQRWTESEDGKRYMRLSSEAWGEADAEAGADPAQAREAAGRTAAAYTG
jgi:uncharacterized protein YndB with AHSA1/START domain